MLKLCAFALLMLAAPQVFAATMSVEGLIDAVVYIAIIGLIFWLLWWFIGYVGIPEPFNKVIRVIVALIAVLILLSFLLGFIGHPIFR